MELKKRLKKTLYYGRMKNMDGPSLAMTGLCFFHIYLCLFIYSNIYIAPLQGSLLRGDLCTGLYDVKCRYERIFSESANIKHSKLKESPRFPADRWYGCSESLCQVVSIG